MIEVLFASLRAIENRQRYGPILDFDTLESIVSACLVVDDLGVDHNPAGHLTIEDQSASATAPGSATVGGKGSGEPGTTL